MYRQGQVQSFCFVLFLLCKPPNQFQHFISDLQMRFLSQFRKYGDCYVEVPLFRTLSNQFISKNSNTLVATKKQMFPY